MPDEGLLSFCSSERDPRFGTLNFVDTPALSVSIWIYVDSRYKVGDENHLKVFVSADAARAWFAEHDPEGVAFEYPVMKEPAN